VKTTLYMDKVQDSYAICPEKLLKNEYCSLAISGQSASTYETHAPKTASYRALCSCRTSLVVKRQLVSEWAEMSYKG
jgi:hypothetical protein